MYPISFAADYQGENRNRLTTFFRYFVVIPWAIVLAFYGIGAYFAAIVAWFAIVFTGRYPPGLYEFVGKFVRFSARVNAFNYLATDEYPAFNGDPDDSYPIRVGIPPPLAEYNRMKTLFRLILAIPVYLLAFVQSLILTVVSLIAWFAIVFTGRLSDGLFDPMRSALAYLTRGGAYYLLLTEAYPPFSYEPEAEQAQVGGAQAPALGTPEAQREEPPPPPPPPSS